MMSISNRVDHLGQGEIKISGDLYREDMIVTPKRVTSWRRGRSHLLTINDFQSIISERPARLVIGIGMQDNLQLDEFTKTKLTDLGFEIYTAKTRTAIKKYNSCDDGKKTIGLFHIH